MDDHLAPPVEEPEISTDTAPQEMVHAYDESGAYLGQIFATPTQLLDMKMTAGDAPAPDIEALKAAAIVRVKQTHARTLSRLTGAPTSEERDTWTVKEAAARAHVDGTATSVQTVMLTLEAGDTAGAVDDLAASIIAKAGVYYQLIGTAGNLHKKAKVLINACTTPDELDTAMTAIRDGTQAATAEFMAAMG